MKHVWKMLMAVLLVCTLFLPAMGAAAEETIRMVATCQEDGVRVSTFPRLDAGTWFTIDKGYEVDIVGAVTDDAGTAWYKVECKDPASDSGIYVGYIYAEYLKVNAAEEDDESTGDPSTGTDVTGATGVITADGVNFRADDDTDAEILMVLNEGITVELLSIPSQIGSGYWYKVRFLDEVGYVQSNYIRVVDAGDDGEAEVIAMGVTVNTNGVNFRKGPGTKYDSMAKLKSGIVVELLSIPEKVDANHWYNVRYNGEEGYIQAPYIRVLGQEEDEETDEPTVAPEDEVIVAIGVIVNTNGVNFREEPDVESDSMGKLKSDTVVELITIPKKNDANHWYKVRYDGKVGYIQAPYVSIPGQEDDEETDEPSDEPEEPAIAMGVVVNSDGLNFRKGPGTKYDSMDKLTAGTVVELLSIPEKVDANHWYKARYDGQVGYLLSTYIRVMDDEEDDPSDEPVVPPADEEDEEVTVIAIGVIVNTNGVNFREEPDVESNSMGKLVSGTQVAILSIPEMSSSKHWYKVRYDGKIGYIQAPYVRVAGLEDDEPSDEPTVDPEDEEAIALGVVINTDGLNFRKNNSVHADSMAKLKSGTVVELLSIPGQVSSNHWYKARYDGQVGYLMSTYIRVLGEDEDPDTPTATPEWDEDVVGIGMITSTNGVNFRKSASVNAESMGKLVAGVTVQLLKIPSENTSSDWFKIRYDGKDGYVQAPYVIVLEGEVPEDDDDSDVVGIGSVTSTDGVNFRTGPSKEYGTMGRLSAETVVELLSIPTQVDEDHWYKVRYNGKTGYIQSPFIRVLTVDEDALPDTSEYGYAKLLEASANLRDSAYGETVQTWKGKGSLLRIAGEMVTSGYYEWIPVYYPADSAIYYVRADMVQLVKVENGQIVTPTPAPASRYGYVITTGQGVNLRIQPNAESIAQIPRNTILACVGAPEDPADSAYTWYKVKYNGMTGYLRGDYVRVCDVNGDPIEDDDDPTEPDEDEEIIIYGYIKVTPLEAGNRVNLRDKQAGSRIDLLDEGLILPVIEAKTAAGVYGQYSWYKVRTADGQTGYIRGDCVVECDAYGNEIEPTPTPKPTETISGYVLITGNSVALREEPFGTSLTRMDTGKVYPIVGANKTESGITWYNIKANNKTGYVHGDYAMQLTKEQADAYLETGVVPEITPDPDAVMTNYVITVNTNGLNIRKSYSQDSASVGKVRSGVVMEFIGTKKVGTVTWYNVIYNDVERWAHGDYLQQMTQAEYKAYLAQNPDFVPDITDNLGYVRTVQSNVYIRNAADGSERIDKIEKKNTVMRYYAEGIEAGEYEWYRILTPDGEFGYVRSDLVEKCDQYGEALPTPTPNLGDLSSAPKSQQETTYTTLELGDTGAAVTNLVAELKNQGYYTGSVTSNFTSKVEAAVEAFQAVKGLDVDGIAGSATQHALFGTVPIGAGNTSNLEFAIYPVEKIDWFTGGIQQMIPRGANFKIYDVKTGIVWWAHRWAGAYHADIETLTRADSKRLCDIYGVDDLQEIVDENMWERRPCLVTIGTRTFACSLDGMQHNPDGDTISNNGMDGQICLHFTNSTGHSAGAGVSKYHKEAIEYAYDNCPAGQK